MGLLGRKNGLMETAAASSTSAQPSTQDASSNRSSLAGISSKDVDAGLGTSVTKDAKGDDALQKETSVIIGPNITVPIDVKPPLENSSDEKAINHEASQEHIPAETGNISQDIAKDNHQVEAQEKNGISDEVINAGSANEDDDDAEDETQYPGGLKLAVLSAGLCLAIFVVALDNTIIATAIPHITTVFDSLGDVGWYGSAYLLTTTSLQPSFGKVYTYMDVKYTYLSALVIFEVGSVLCAAATSSKMLIVGRAVAGAGAAALFSGGMTIIGYTVPLRKRPFYIALLSSMFGISSIVGPILGGALTDSVTWRWCFWINLPFGGCAIAVVAIFFRNPARRHTQMSWRQKVSEVDLVGAVLLICAIVCLLLALQWGGSTYPWKDSKVWGCLLGFGLILIVFIIHQSWRGDRATIPPRILLRQRTVFSCAWFSAFLAMGLYAHIYYIPIYFQAIKGTTAEQSGIRLIAYLVSNTVLAIIVGGAITTIGYYVPFMWIAAIIFTIGAGLLTTLKVDSSAGIWIGYQILAGAGSGMGVQIPFTAVQVVLNKKDMPSGNAITIFFNTLGGAISISITQNIFLNKLIQETPKYVPGLNPAVILGAGATHFREAVTPQQLPGVLAAYDKAVTSAFYMPVATGAICFFFSLLMEWRSVKGKKVIAAGGA